MNDSSVEIQTPSDVLNKLSTALIQVSRGDPLVSLRNELTVQFRSIETQIDSINKATALYHEDTVRVPTLVDKATTSLRDVLVQMMKTYIAEVQGDLHRHIAETLQKFMNVDGQFTERDTRTDQRAGDTKLAVDAAFAAAKEATAKIEAGFTKQIDAMIILIDTKTANLASGISDIKDRLTAIESRSGVTDPATAEALRELTLMRIGQSGSMGHAVGQTAGITQTGALILGGFVILSALVAFASLLYNVFKHDAGQGIPPGYVYRDPPPGYYVIPPPTPATPPSR